MTKERKSFSEHLRESLNEERALESGGLLGSISAHDLNGKPLAAETTVDRWIHLDKTPRPRDIDYTRTDDGMVIEGKAILKDGRRVTF